MKNNKSSAQTPKDLLNDLHTLVAEAEKMVGETVGEHTHEAIATLRERFESAQERFSDLYADTRKKVVAGAKYTDETIRENPYQSIAVVAGVALLVGILLGRRSGD